MFSAPPVQKVSVVIPVYNEQESLPELIRRTTAACETLGKAYEILLVDDGSSDNSALMLTEAAQAEGSHIVAVLLNRNYGQHSAIMAGFSHVTGFGHHAGCRSAKPAGGDPPAGRQSRRRVRRGGYGTAESSG